MFRIGASCACALAAVAACSRSTDHGVVDGHASAGTAVSATLVASSRAEWQSDAAANDIDGGGLKDARAVSRDPWGDDVTAATSLDAAGAVDAPTRCLADAGALRGPVVVRFVVQSKAIAIGNGDYCRETALDLEIPARRVRHTLCGSGCGPYRFVNRKESSSRATFECQQDLWPVEGSVSIADGVVVIETANAQTNLTLSVPSLGGREAEAPTPPASSPQRELIPLPCGVPVVLQTSPPSQWPSEAELSR